MAKMKAGDDDNDTSNDELIAPLLIEEACSRTTLPAAGRARTRRRARGNPERDAPAGDPWRQAECGAAAQRRRRCLALLEDCPTHDPVGLKR